MSEATELVLARGQIVHHRKCLRSCAPGLVCVRRKGHPGLCVTRADVHHGNVIMLRGTFEYLRQMQPKAAK